MVGLLDVDDLEHSHFVVLWFVRSFSELTEYKHTVASPIASNQFCVGAPTCGGEQST